MNSNIALYTADSRGKADHGWLKSAHTFSFASYHNPLRMQFGVLRVINDDEIDPGMGFGTHPHDNMEIITLPLEGVLAHKDSLGHESIITTGEVQVMSAGSGITHSEYNASNTVPLKLFQIWVMTQTPNIKPRYDQKKFDFTKPNQWIHIVEPITATTTGLGIHQNARFSIATLTPNTCLTYSRYQEQNGLFVMVIEGKLSLSNFQLGPKDAIALEDAPQISLTSLCEARVLVMDVPMGARLKSS